MFALLELDHADFGPLFESRDEALAALLALHDQLPEEARDFGIVELDKAGFPVGQPITVDEVVPKPEFA